MKVGIYLAGNPPELGGAYIFEQNVLNALRELAAQSHHEFILCWENAPSSLKNFGNLKVIPFVRQAKFLKFLRLAANKIQCWPLADWLEDPLQRLAKQEGIEFMVFLTPAYCPIEIPYMANMWDIQHRVQPWFPEVNYRQEWPRREAFFSQYLQQAAYVIAPNDQGMKELSFFYRIPDKRFCLLTHPTPEITDVLTENEVSAVLHKYNLSSGYLFYPAQFWPHKNHANLLLALKNLKEQHRLSLDLVLVGSDKGNRSYIQELVKQSGLQEQVHFLGFIPRQDLIALYKGALALVYVTLFGPENLPPLEAFACGCPVIASNVPGAQEQLGDAALLCHALDPKAIAAAVKKVKDDPALRNSLITKGHARAGQFKAKDFVQGIFTKLDEFEAVRRNWK